MQGLNQSLWIRHLCQKIQIVFKIQIRIHPPLEQNLGPPQIQGLPNLIRQILPGDHIAPAALGSPVKGTEPAPGDTDIGVVDVPVHHKGDCFVGMLPEPYLLGKPCQLQKRGVHIEAESLVPRYSLACPGPIQNCPDPLLFSSIRDSCTGFHAFSPTLLKKESRSTGSKPAHRIIFTISSRVSPLAEVAPAVWVIRSSMMVPSRSSAP